MAAFLKDVLYPGTYRLADGRRVTFAPAKVSHLRQRVKDMLAAGLQIPLAWEHQDDAKPMTAAEVAANKARFNLGFATDADLTPDGYLETKLDVPSDEDAKRLPSVRFVSPEIQEDFVDGTGRLWPGSSITHLAVTSRPVQHNQKPFRPTQLSLTRVRLSLGDYEMADAKPEKDKGKTEPEPEGGNGPKLKKILAALAKAGISLPDDTDEGNFMDRLYAVAESKAGDTADVPKAPDEEPTAVSTPAPAGVSMSLEDTKRLQAMEARALKLERADLTRRVKNLFSTGRIGKPIHDKLMQQATAVKLSLGDDGAAVPNAVAAKVEAYEELAAGSAFPVNERLSMGRRDEPQPVPEPGEARRAPETPEEAEPAINAFFQTVPGYDHQPANGAAK